MNRHLFGLLFIFGGCYSSGNDVEDSRTDLPRPGTHENPIIEFYYFSDEFPSSTTRVDTLLKNCPDLGNQNVSSTCLAVLGDTFHNDPIWAAARYEYHQHSRVRTMLPVLSDRLLSYSYPDFIGEVPRWKDILDIDFNSTVALVSRVLHDNSCQGLKFSPEGIHSELSEYCHAKDLYAYVSYMDSCVSNQIRHQEMSQLTQLIDEPARAVTRYEKSLESISSRWLSKEMYEEQYAMQLKQNLRTTWLAHVCMDARDIIRAVIGIETTQIDLLEFPFSEPGLQMQDHYSTVLQIAAKSGNRWALQSYTPFGENATYWRDLYERNPLLVHRLLASSLAQFELTDEQHNQHVIKTKSMLQQMFPRASFLPDTYGGSPEAIRYIENNGELTFPWDVPERFPQLK